MKSKIIKSDLFDTMDSMFKNKQASSSEFKRTASNKFFECYEATTQNKEALHDLLCTYKAIIKQEVMIEMQKYIENFDTFYN